MITKLTQTEVQMRNALLAAGFIECLDQFRPGERMFYKQYETPTRCARNDDKSGQQVSIHVGTLNIHDEDCATIEMEVCGELTDGTWVKLQNYSLPKNVPAVLAMIPRLLHAWEAVNQHAALVTRCEALERGLKRIMDDSFYGQSTGYFHVSKEAISDARGLVTPAHKEEQA